MEANDQFNSIPEQHCFQDSKKQWITKGMAWCYGHHDVNGS
jgi:hypothetical protein